MAKFTFTTGNARAVLRLPAYLLGALAAAIVSRSDRLWVFGCGIGPGEGALPLYRHARERLGGDVRLVWLAGSRTEADRARALGLDTAMRSSARGLWLTLRARVLVVTHGLGDVNRFGVWGGFVVQLWHGVPLKKLHLDSPAALRLPVVGGSAPVRALLGCAMRVVTSQIKLFPVSSERVADRIASAFGLARERIAVTGDPRDDVLFRGTAGERRSAARALLRGAVGELPETARLVLYAPTWRDGEHDPSAPDAAEWWRIEAWAQRTDTVLVVRAHPLARDEYVGATGSPHVRVLTNAALPDVTGVLAGFDALVTDYSSIAFDFALIDGPTVFYAPDLHSYARTRGLYDPYRSFSGGAHVADWDQVMGRLDALADTSSPEAIAAAAHARRLREEYFDFHDGDAAERVYSQIMARLGGATPRRAAGRSRPTITALRFVQDGLHVELDGVDRDVDAVELAGPRARVRGDLVTGADGRASAHLPLLVTRWSVPGLALPSGNYRLGLAGADATTRLELAPSAARACDAGGAYRARAEAEDGGVVVRIGPPLDRGERRPHPRLPPSAAYALHPPAPENAVYFESFYGRAACDNPLGIDRVLARDHPQVRRYWSVADASVPVPDGAVRLIEGSDEWWRVRAAARVLVVNDWLRWFHRRRPHQHVLQTWHGTMLKRLARDRAGHTPRQRLAAWRQGRRWDALLAQNEYSAAIFRSAYAYAGPIWTTGYPRNDVLADPDRAASVRSTLGVAPGVRAVLYAPTWRDDSDTMVDHLDLRAFAASLPPDQVLLVRGHSRTLDSGEELGGERLVDVTGYPDVADLMLVADLLVTDYSSVMFDFTATGKPMVFYTPDLAHYGDVLRGFYFDLLGEAPGPVVRTGDELRAAIADPDAPRYAARYAAWRAKFTAHDDGHAGERVVTRLFAEGWLDRG